jgi:hypothetical protein
MQLNHSRRNSIALECTTTAIASQESPSLPIERCPATTDVPNRDQPGVSASLWVSRPQTRSEWAAFWVGLARRGGASDATVEALQPFLEAHPMHPGAISPAALAQYVREHAARHADAARALCRALRFFYSLVVRGKQWETKAQLGRLDSLEADLEETPVAPVAESADSRRTLPLQCTELLARLRRQLVARNYSRRTLHNYEAAVRLYLAHEGAPDSESCAEAFTTHICRLAEKRRAAPSTINLHAAAACVWRKSGCCAWAISSPNAAYSPYARAKDAKTAS